MIPCRRADSPSFTGADTELHLPILSLFFEHILIRLADLISLPQDEVDPKIWTGRACNAQPHTDGIVEVCFMDEIPVVPCPTPRGFMGRFPVCGVDAQGAGRVDRGVRAIIPIRKSCLPAGAGYGAERRPGGAALCESGPFRCGRDGNRFR
jgi:hypothetical protein